MSESRLISTKIHGRMARVGHGLTKGITRALHTQPHRALRAVTTETVVSEVAAHDAVFYPLGYPTSYAYSKMDHVRNYRCCKPRLTSTSHFYALRATPKTALDFGRLVDRSQGSHTNVTLPFQFRHPGPPFPTLLRPAGHPQNGLRFWSVGRLVGQSVGHREVTRMSCCHFSFVTRPALPDPSTPCGPPPKRP
jgi:hypothetical protein